MTVPGIRRPTVKLLVFNQRVRIVQIDSDRFRNHRRAFFDMQLEQAPDLRQERDARRTRRTAHTARRHYLRAPRRSRTRRTSCAIDCYQVGSRIVLGEMTHCPGTGLSPLYPAIWDDRWGAMWERRLE